MDHLIYSTQVDGFETGASYSNPEYYRGEVHAADKVTVYGDWPNIVEAYSAKGIEVEVINAPQKTHVDGIGTDSGDQFSNEQLREAIEAVTGKKTHPAMKRENLIAQFNKLNAQQQ